MNIYSFICFVKPRDEHKIDQIFQATLILVKQKGLAGITSCLPSAENLPLIFTLKITMLPSLFRLD